MGIIWFYSLTSVLIVSLISFVGIVTLPIKLEKLKDILLYIVSFAAGSLLGDVFIHLFPDVVKEKQFNLQSSFYILVGIIITFMIEKIVHWKHEHATAPKHAPHPVSIMSLVGDSVHNSIDGLIIGSSYLISLPAGIATTIAVIFHEIPHEIGNFGVLLHGGFSKNKALFFNFLTALTAFIGVILSVAIGQYAHKLIGFLTMFAIGNLIYIAGSDLIPELHKHNGLKESIWQLIFFILGIVAMTGLLLLE